MEQLTACMIDGFGWFEKADYRRGWLSFSDVDYIFPEDTTGPLFYSKPALHSDQYQTSRWSIPSDAFEAVVESSFLDLEQDSLAHLLTWSQPDRLIELCRLAVVARPGYRADLAELEATLPGVGHRLDWVEMPVLGISSSDLQRRVREGRSIRYQVPAAVASYVAKHGLYHDNG